MSEEIISIVEKRKKEALGKEKKKPKTRKAPVRKVVDSKKGEKKEPVKRRVKETMKKKRKVYLQHLSLSLRRYQVQRVKK